MELFLFGGIDSVEELILLAVITLIAFMISIAFVFLNRWLKAKMNIKIFENEEQMRIYLFQAIVNGFFAVIKNNNFADVKEKEGDTISAVKEYIKQTSPETLKRLNIDTQSDVLDKIIKSQINQIIVGKLPQNDANLSVEINQDNTKL